MISFDECIALKKNDKDAWFWKGYCQDQLK